MARRELDTYRRKRDFSATEEPAGDGAVPAAEAPRFVIQEHHATRLHWDLRLEHDGVLASWAVPNGIPPDPHENRLAVHTEDHPLEYLDFHGEIPRGSYGAGTMTIWDRGTYELHKWEPKKVEVTFHGERLEGRYGLFPIGRAGEGDKDWMIHRMDAPQDPAREPMPSGIVPMLARAGTLPEDEARWSFEVKWDGIRALAYIQPGRLRLESRNLRDITDGYPEIRGILLQTGMRELILDGEIIAFDEQGRPSFSQLQRRMHVTAPSAVKRLQGTTPVVYAIFDVLFCDGHSLMSRPYSERRAALDALALDGSAWRIPAAHPGRGRQLLEATAAQGLEGVIAKRLDCPYEPGRRATGWIKVKHRGRQELVIGGWIPGEGRRTERIGALLMGMHGDGGELRFAGRVGTGFTERTLDELGERLAPLRREDSPFTGAPKLPRNTQWVDPVLVAEIEFVEWTPDGVMRAPSFKGLREDKSADEVVREPGGAWYEAMEELPEGARALTVDGRRLKVTNWDKVLYPQTGFTKGALIDFYARLAPVLVPHLRDRPLTLKRYPSGVEAQYFYEKQSPSHRPEWVQTAQIGDINFTLAQDRSTLVWLGGLADIELHTSLALAGAPERPLSVVFDLDPGPPADIVQCCQVALVLRGLFGQLGLECLVKTSGSKGMQLYVPLNSPVGYDATKTFAKRIAELLEARMPELVVSRMTKRIRSGKVLVDWSQNDFHKTTVNVYSVRARERPTVSTPLHWAEVEAAHRTSDAEALRFETEDVLARVERDGDLFAPLLSTVQSLPSAG